MKGFLDFAGTIDGTTYFLRGLVATLFSIVGIIGFDYFGAHPVADVIVGITALASFIGAVVLNFSTINKRLNALLPDQKTLGWILCFIPYVSFIMSLYLIFANSKIENHDG